MAEFAWFAKRVFIVAFVVGMFWNDAPIGEELGVYMILLGCVLMAEWIREYRPPETPKQRAERYLGSGLQERAERSLRGRPWEGAVDWDELERGIEEP